jgi:predicted phage terminase large subunit-like protein
MVMDLEHYLSLLEYELALQEAEDDLLRFAEVTMPEMRFPDDISRTRYKAGRHHRLMADLMMQVERGERRKVIINTAPRHGKSELCTKRFCAWYSALHPDHDIIVATYNEKFALDFGKDIREIMSSPRFQQVFPEFYLKSASNETVTTYAGGDIFFLGRRSSTTGRGANLIIVDDPTKDDKDVRYDGFREDVWQWFTQTLLTRRHDDRAAIVISQTRWHEDDIVGRITDKQNPAYSPKFSEGFEIVNLPAIAEHDDPLKRKPGEPLWPERFGLKYLEEMQDANPASFAALYQCDPTPDDGVFFRVEEIHEYEAGELPEKLTMYVASDHAVGTKNINDPSCLVPFGLDENGTAWVMPQIVWRRMDAQEAVEEMIGIMRSQKPVFWYAEKGHITKSIGPFLSKRMEEEGVYTPVLEEQPIGDKIQRAQSGRARCAQGKIKFPKHAPWWPRAKSEMLKFPNARFDDFVDVVSMIGLKVGYHTGPSKVIQKPKHQPGTFGYMLAEFRKQDREDAFRSEAAGWGISR